MKIFRLIGCVGAVLAAGVPHGPAHAQQVAAPAAAPAGLPGPVTNAGITVQIERIVRPGQPDYLPLKTDIQQIWVSVRNGTQDVIKVSDIHGQLADGTLTEPLQAPDLIPVEPEATRQANRLASQLSNMLVSQRNSSLGLALGLGTDDQERRKSDDEDRRMELAEKQGLPIGSSIPPGAKVSGYVFIQHNPAQAKLSLILKSGSTERAVQVPLGSF